MAFFSIIIPVYNVAPYLRECLDSVLAQTFTDWEAVCVDDGSTDGSGGILDEYGARDKRFRVIHQENNGVSAARNTALALISGEWFLFLDGDDVLRLDGLEQFVPHVMTCKCDGALVHPYIPYWHGDGIPVRGITTKVLVEGASREDLVLGPYAANGFVISRIYRRSIFGGLRFPVGVQMAEDVHFWFDALCVPAKWMILNAEYYLYRNRANSVCGRKSPNDCVAILESVLYACGKISGEMGLGVAGARRYIERWPASPVGYLNIFVARQRELGSGIKCQVVEKVRGIARIYGRWPYQQRLRLELWFVERDYGVLLLLFRGCCAICRVPLRIVNFLCYVRSNGIGSSVRKIKRFALRQGEYQRNNTK